MLFQGLRKEDSDDLDKMELPFDVNDLESKSKLAKKPTYLGETVFFVFYF